MSSCPTQRPSNPAPSTAHIAAHPRRSGKLQASPRKIASRMQGRSVLPSPFPLSPASHDGSARLVSLYGVATTATPLISTSLLSAPKGTTSRRPSTGRIKFCYVTRSIAANAALQYTRHRAIDVECGRCRMRAVSNASGGGCGTHRPSKQRPSALVSIFRIGFTTQPRALACELLDRKFVAALTSLW